MLSIFVETSCNRYERDECITCHVFEPLNPYEASEQHLSPEQAQIMADKIKQIDVLAALAREEINLTGGEASMNPHIVEVFRIFQTLTPNVCLHTNLDMNSKDTKRWKRLLEIMNLSGRIDITLYPTVWESRQRHFLDDLIRVQKRLLINIIYEKLPDLLKQVEILNIYFKEKGSRFDHVVQLLEEYLQSIENVVAEEPDCIEEIFQKRVGNTQAFAPSDDFTLGLNMLPAFDVGHDGVRPMNSIPFPKDLYLLQCPAARGSIEIMTIQQDGRMTPCCDVGNLKCQPKFGNLLTDTPEEILSHFESSRIKMARGIAKNKMNIQHNRAGELVEEKIPPYCV